LVLGLVGNVQADQITWTDGTGDHLWSTAGNWDIGLPTLADWAKVRNGLPGATVANEGAVAQKVHVGYEEGSALTVDGGSLTIAQDILLGKKGGSGTLNMISGVINCVRDLEVGGGNPGIINMTGGTITVGDDFMIPEVAGSIADVNLDDGTITVDDDLNMSAGGTMNITGGTLIIAGDVVSTVQGYIDNGWITAYDGSGRLNLDYDTTNPGRTTLTASVSENASSPNPANGAGDVARTPTLTWSPGDNVADANGNELYFSSDRDAVANRTADMIPLTDPNYSAAGTLDLGKTYYWVVDTVNDPCNWPGALWSFTTIDYLVVEDFESYDWDRQLGEDVNWVYYVWADGLANFSYLPDMGGNDTGANVFTQYDTVLGGLQAMRFDYNNNGFAENPRTGAQLPRLHKWSKAKADVSDLPSGIGSDWVSRGTRALSLWFYGDSLNDIEPMWVELADSSGRAEKVTYGNYAGEEPNHITEASWREWSISLQDFNDGGVDLADVNSIAIGFGTEGDEIGGGYGSVFFDDITIHTPRCTLSRRSAEIAKIDYAPEGDPAGDCVIDYKELDVMTRDWLERDVAVIAQAPVASELLVHWAFDETSGLIASDSSGNGRTGDVNNLSGVSWVTDDDRGRCFDFSNGDNVRAITDSNVYMDGLDALTVALWVKSNEIGTDSGFIIFEEPIGNDKRNIRYDSVGADSDGINLIKYGVTVPPDEGVHDGREEDESSAGVQTTSWQHIAMTWQNGVGLKLYIDGALDIAGNDENTRPGLTTGYDILMVGKGSKDDGNNEGWNGRIDDVRIYSYALSQSEIVSVMGLAELYVPIISPAEIYDSEDPGDRAINFKDYDVLLQSWLLEFYQ